MNGIILLITLLSPAIFCADLSDNEGKDFILHEIAKMKNTISAEYNAKVAELKESYEAKMTGLKAELKADYEANLKESKADFVVKLAELKDENKELRNRVHQLESESKRQGSAKETSESSQQKDNNNVVSSRPTSLRRHKTRQSGQVYAGQVAFTAGVSAYDLTGLGAHHTIIFDRIISNIGGAYHSHTGIFISPLKGVYVFSITLMVSPRHSQYLELVVDGNPVDIINADADTIQDYISAHKNVVIEADQASEVWVRTKTSGGAVHGNMYTQFTGFLLYELE